VYKLADELGFELDDLFPIVEAAQLLGYLKLERATSPSRTAAGSLPTPRF